MAVAGLDHHEESLLPGVAVLPTGEVVARLGATDREVSDESSEESVDLAACELQAGEQ